MKKRDIPSIFLFQFLTLGIYFLYWCWRSKNEVNQKLGNKSAPTMWWFIVPFGNYWWAWQYSQAVEAATKKKIRYSDAFGYFLVASLGLASAYWLPTPDVTNVDGSLNTGVLVGTLIAFYVLAVAVASIFPAAMQSRFNKLSGK